MEFVSANPTGPLHVGHGRQAALGDAISSLLEWTGWNVSREFYYNDAGVQIENLAQEHAGARARAARRAARDSRGRLSRRVHRRDRASATSRQHPADPRRATTSTSMRRFAVQALRKEQDLDLQAFGVQFDTYFLESSLYTDGRVERTVDALVAQRQDVREGRRAVPAHHRVRRRPGSRDAEERGEGGTYTYFVPDVAYHVTKWERGFTRAINVQGADHHSTVTRVRAGLQALGMGIPAGYPEYVLHQMVTVMKGGEEMKISKRAGSYVTVRDLDRRGRPRRGSLLLPDAEGRLAAVVRRRSRALAERGESGLLHPDGARAPVRASSASARSIRRRSIRRRRISRRSRSTEETELMKALLDFPALVAARPRRSSRSASRPTCTRRRDGHLWYHKAHVLERARADHARAARARARGADRAAERARDARHHGAGSDVDSGCGEW